MVHANQTWGEERIGAELLLTLGIAVSRHGPSGGNPVFGRLAIVETVRAGDPFVAANASVCRRSPGHLRLTLAATVTVTVLDEPPLLPSAISEAMSTPG
jgi:hypothetical protein